MKIPSTQTFSSKFRDWIETEIQRLPPGSRLPTSKEFSQQWNLSLITIQRVLTELRNLGKINRVPGKGTFISGDAPKTDWPENTQPQPRALADVDLADKIKDGILNGIFRKGQALPIHQYFQVRFQLSGRTVSSAYRLLRDMRLVEKIGRKYFVSSLLDNVQDAPFKEVFCVSSEFGSFQSLFHLNQFGLSFRKLEHELASEGFTFNYCRWEELDRLCAGWRKKGIYPRGLIFFGIGQHNADSLTCLLKENFSWRHESKTRILVNWIQGDTSKLPSDVNIMAYGNSHTKIARHLARYLLSHGHKKIGLVYREDPGGNPGLYYAYFKIALEMKSLDPDVTFHTLFVSEPANQRSCSIYSILDQDYRDYLHRKYPRIPAEFHEAGRVYADASPDAFYPAMNALPDIKMWLFPNEAMAAIALEKSIQDKILIPSEREIITFEGDPAFYHLGFSMCIVDWERTGHLMAHALMGDSSVRTTSKGYLEIKTMMLYRKTTKIPNRRI